MAEICTCNTGNSNTGLPSCISIFKTFKRLINVPLYDSTGALNKIDPASPLNKAWIDALLNHADVTKRYFPLPEMKNVTTDKGDPQYEEWADGSKELTREGIRTFVGILTKVPPSYKAKLESSRCNETGAIGIDTAGNIIGLKKGTDGYLYPIPMASQSVYAKFEFGNDSQVQKITYSFDIPSTVNDADFVMITANAFTDFSMLDIQGLIDVSGTPTNISTTGFKVKLLTEYGALNDKITAKGWLLANFSLAEVSPTPGSISITSVTESSTVPGEYTFVIPAQTSADVLRLTLTKSGYIGGPITVTIP